MQERRRLIAELRRKYGEDLAAVLAFAKEAATRLDELENAEGLAATIGSWSDATVVQELERAPKRWSGRMFAY